MPEAIASIDELFDHLVNFINEIRIRIKVIILIFDPINPDSSDQKQYK